MTEGPNPRLAVVAPGQGAQAAGMLAGWLDLAPARTVVETVSADCGLDLIALGTSAPAEALRPTEVAQPLLFATALASAAVALGEKGLPARAVVAGHSIGEWAAAVLSGALSLGAASRLVAERGRAMAEAAAAHPSSMAAVLGGDTDEVLAHLASLGLWPANVNGAGQVVAAGPAEAVELLVSSPPAGARVRRLDVAAAFHTPLMASAETRLRGAATAAAPDAPSAIMVGNRNGQVLSEGDVVLEDLLAQVSAPVRFDRVLQRFSALGVTGVLELAPAGVLTPLVRRQLPGVATLALRSPGDLDAARDFVREHSGADVGCAA